MNEAKKMKDINWLLYYAFCSVNNLKLGQLTSLSFFKKSTNC